MDVTIPVGSVGWLQWTHPSTAAGLTNREVAGELVIAESTAQRHVANLLARLDFTSRTQIVAWALEAPNLPHAKIPVAR